MKNIYISVILVSILAAILLAGCENKTTPPDASAYPPSNISDTSYVEIFPPWGPYMSPRALIIGSDQLIYVADYDANTVYMLNSAGVILKQRQIPHPISISQNSKLDLYVGAETIAPNGTDTIGAIYRIALVRWDTVYQSGIRIDSLRHDTIKVFRDTSYFYEQALDNGHMRLVFQEPGRPGRRFPGIGVLPGNQYLVARVGPDNSSFVDPDTRVLLFSKEDILETPIADLVTRASGGTAITDIRNPTGLMIFPSSRDFILTQSSEQVAYGAIWMVYYDTRDFKGWLPKFDPSKADQAGIDFVKQNRFHNAVAAAYDSKRREVFIVDADLDSVVKFNRNGQFKAESFGKYKSISPMDSTGLWNPSGIAFSNDNTLYIADTKHGLIRRFKLSTQL